MHDARSPSRAQAYLLAALGPPEFPMAYGIFRQVEKPTYDGLLMAQDRRRDRQERAGRTVAAVERRNDVARGLTARDRAEVVGVVRSTRSRGLDDAKSPMPVGPPTICRLQDRPRSDPPPRSPALAGGRRTVPASEWSVVLLAAMAGDCRAARAGRAGVDGGRRALAPRDPSGSRLALGGRRRSGRRQRDLPGHGPHGFAPTSDALRWRVQGLWLQIMLDLAVLTVVVHYLGSLETYAPFMYLFHIVLACIFFPRRAEPAGDAVGHGDVPGLHSPGKHGGDAAALGAGELR